MQGGFRNRLVAAAMGGVLLALAVPVSAQQYSDGYNFLEAVDEKDRDAARVLLDKPGSTVVNSRYVTNGRTGMHIAVARRDVEWIRFLAQYGANPNIADKSGTTPLILAAQMGFVDGVRALVAAGARVDVPNDAGETPLIYAVHSRDMALMRVLLEAGANPDRRDNSGRSARDYATMDGASSPLLAELNREAGARGGAGASPTYGPSL